LEEHHFEEINAYYKGEMDVENTTLFEAKLILDQSLAKDYHEFINTIGKFKADNPHPLKLQFQKIEEQLNKTEVIKANYSFQKYLSIAASVVFIFLITWFGYNKYNQNNFTALEIKEAGLPVLMGVNDKVEFDNAMTLYKMNKFDESLALFLKLQKSSTNDTLNYFIGLNYYELKNYPQARAKFAAVGTNSIFYNKSLYFLGFSYLKQNEKDKAIPFFKQLSTTDNDLQSNAKNILKKISE
jgi:tetratricopeptide (TPR) repeat protein